MTLPWSASDTPVLRDVDIALARALARHWPGADEAALRAAAVASWAVQEGHGCLDLGVLRGDGAMRALLASDARVGDVAPDAWRAALASAPFSGDGAGATPLVLDGERVYLKRYFDYEREVAAALRARLPAMAAGVPAAVGAGARTSECVDRIDRQQLAIERALAAPLTVVCGGPGTGKTWTIARIVERVRAASADTRIALAAPTGKAAARLATALHDALPGTTLEATTLHRLVGLGGADRAPRHDAARPVPFDLVVVDECSMVDLALFAKLLRALRADARLVLVGDPGQLPAVEGGAVLGELAALGARADVVTLDRAVRFEGGGAVAALTRAVAAGDADATHAALRAEGIAWHDAPLAESRAAFEALSRRAYGGLARAGGPLEALAALARFRILCPLRAGPHGVAGLNAAVEATLGVARGERASYEGRPILVTRNDAALGLSNGDAGVVLHDAADARAYAYIAGPSGAPRRFALAHLPGHETAYAMTAHKAQGSEFDEVAVVLPPEPHPLVTREWLYTAVSRARRGVHVFATRAAIEAALARRVTIMSGLRARLSPSP